jgi:hypothetical protein
MFTWKDEGKQQQQKLNLRVKDDSKTSRVKYLTKVDYVKEGSVIRKSAWNSKLAQFLRNCHEV